MNELNGIQEWWKIRKKIFQQLAVICEALHLEATPGHFGLLSSYPKEKNKGGVTLFNAAKKLLNKCNTTPKRERTITGHKLIQQNGEGTAPLSVLTIL